tara:strand:+ start:2962 stop:3231 length:270 start_codon:yes stop_codon:yes gene_type:complete
VVLDTASWAITPLGSDTCHVDIAKDVFGNKKAIGDPDKKHVVLVVMHCALLDLLTKINTIKITILKHEKNFLNIDGENMKKKQIIFPFY